MPKPKTPKYQRGAIYVVEVVVPGWKSMPATRYTKEMKLIDTRKDGVLVMEERYMKAVGFAPLAKDAAHQIASGSIKHKPGYRQILVKRSRVKGMVSAPDHSRPAMETESMKI